MMPFKEAIALCFALTSGSAAASGSGLDEAALANLPGMGSPPSVVGKNLDGGSVFKNYLAASAEGQFFLRWEATIAGTRLLGLRWCSHLDFDGLGDVPGTGISSSQPVGYTAKCVGASLEHDAGHCESPPSAALSPEPFNDTNSLSTVFLSQINGFQGEYHSNTNNWIARFWDSGSPSMFEMYWKTATEKADAATDSWSANGLEKWISAETMACLLNRRAGDFTLGKF